MISMQAAKSIAEQEITRHSESASSPGKMWPGGETGHPVLVHDVFRQPSYWLVPYIFSGRAAGFVRIHGDGNVLATGSFCARADQLERCPPAVTGLTREEALQQFTVTV